MEDLCLPLQSNAEVHHPRKESCHDPQNVVAAGPPLRLVLQGGAEDQSHVPVEAQGALGLTHQDEVVQLEGIHHHDPTPNPAVPIQGQDARFADPGRDHWQDVLEAGALEVDPCLIVGGLLH